jgi:hypothetical protein
MDREKWLAIRNTPRIKKNEGKVVHVSTNYGKYKDEKTGLEHTIKTKGGNTFRRTQGK